MAKINEPKSGGRKGSPPMENKPSQDLTKKDIGQLVGLNFKVSSEFRKDFKGYALDHDLTMNELLKKCFSVYKESQK